jgi:hypothetical protein
MAYTKYSLTPGSNTAAPPDGAPEGMLPSAVNDTMRDMMAQIRDCGDGIRGGTYTMTAPVITGGSITGSTVNNAVIGGTTRAAGSFTTVTTTNDASISGLTVGKGGGAVTQNTALGTSALAANTGAYNTAVGYRALLTNTSGTDNNAFGQASLQLNTTGSQNLGMGSGALYSNTTGSNNTALGYNALVLNTTASNNTAVGYQSMYGNTTGTYCTAVGYGSLDANTTGLSNNAFGFDAVGGVTTGSQNNGFGTDALKGVTTASGNTAIGHGSGYLITTGAKNTIIGTYSGNQGGLDIRTASNYIVLSDGDGNPRLIYNGATLINNATSVLGSRNTASAFDINGKDSAMFIQNYGSGIGWGIEFRPSASAGSGNGDVISFTNTSFTQVGKITTTSSATAYATSSDYRLKENVAPMSGALSTISQLKPVTFKWIVDGKNGQGFIAHELQEICPDAVSGEKDALDKDGNPSYQGVDASFLVATLVSAIQELNAKLEAQALEIATLKGK